MKAKNILTLITCSFLFSSVFLNKAAASQKVTYYSKECNYTNSGITQKNGTLYSFSAGETRYTSWFSAPEQAVCPEPRSVMGEFKSLIWPAPVIYDLVYVPLSSVKLLTRVVTE
ncbi:hypothetical protein J8L98_24360 [Pseudoalteromonas sp. MMG013]|uniref:hypothetical protein n=1 Tax=Pseudoalteromonas sp. MMG013 TaxID=2822687 RepID=UPI001B35D5E6|nr:hypothetical protein [Pseudoalteromonas sp. MMG013]MBQ4864822.1 hypothetical protein [Pseudoalteromonas sp. MMG013]